MSGTNSFITAYDVGHMQVETTGAGNERNGLSWCETMVGGTSPNCGDPKLDGSLSIRSGKLSAALGMTQVLALGVVSERKCNAGRGWRVDSVDNALYV